MTRYDIDKVLSFDKKLGVNTIKDSQANLENCKKYVKNKDFANFNFVELINLKFKFYEDIKNNIKVDKYDYLNEELKNSFFNEINFIKLVSEKMLYTFSVILKDETSYDPEEIIMEGLTGFLYIKSEEIVLESIYRFETRDGNHKIYEDTNLNIEEDIKEKGQKDKRTEILKILTVQEFERRHLPLYFSRITFKVSKDTKLFNLPIYLSIINLLYAKKLYQPCITLLSLLIEEISIIAPDMYQEVAVSQKAEGFLMFFEFLLFKKVYLLMFIGNFERALLVLSKVEKSVSVLNQLFHKLLSAVCYARCFYFELAIYNFHKSYSLISNFLKVNDNALDQKEQDQKDKEDQVYFNQESIERTMSLEKKKKDKNFTKANTGKKLSPESKFIKK